MLEERVVLSTITVLTDADAGPGSLRAALAAAESGDVVQFDPGLFGRTIHLTSGELDIDEDLTIQGPGASLLGIDAGGLSRVFDIESPDADVTISGLTISGGKAATGGGVLVQGGGLTLVDAVIAGNQASTDDPGGSASGGGVAVLEGGTLTATDSVFQGNSVQGGRGSDGGTARRNGFGGGAFGGAIYTEGSSLTIVGGAFLGNRVTGGRGGDGGAGAGTSSGFAFNDFGGSASGGGLYVASGSLSISGATLADNQALGGEGGVAAGAPYSRNGVGGMAAGGALAVAFDWPPPDSPNVLSNSIFRNNGAEGGSYAGRDFLGSATGGAVYNEVDGLIIDDCNFASNWIDGGYTVTGSFFVPTTFSMGGAVRSSGVLGVSESTFVANRASGYIAQGSAICADYANVTDSTFRDNQATGWFNNGGVIYADDLDLSRSTFTNNSVIAQGDGGGVSGGVINSSGFRIADCEFVSNTAIGGEGDDRGAEESGGLGGEVIGGVISTLYLFPSGSASGVRTGQFNYFIDESSFLNNRAIGGKGGDGGNGGPGGAVRGGDVAVDGWLSVTDSTFVGTRAIGGDGGSGGSGSGGAGGAAIGGSLSIIDQFGNFSEFNTGPILIDGSTFRSVTAQGGEGGDKGGRGGHAMGGAIAAGAVLNFVYGPLQVPLTISNSLILGAVARGGDGGRNGDGGDARGGAIFLGGISTYGEGPYGTVDIAATLNNVSIFNNTAQGGLGNGAGRGGDGQGGGVFADRYSKIFLSRGAIVGNRAVGGRGGRTGLAGSGVGGGVYLTTGGSVLNRTLIVRNLASTLDDDVHGSFG